MSEAKKKAREKSWLKLFQASVDLKFEIEDQRNEQEKPDFLIRYQERIVGLEIAELQIDRDRGLLRGSALQKELSLQKAVITRAQGLYLAAKNEPIKVLVYFQGGPGQSLVKFNRGDLAQSIFEGLCQLNLGPSEQCRLDQYSNPPVPPPVGFLRAWGLPNESIPRWQVITPGHVKKFQPSDVESLLAEKNSKIGQYRRTVAENWLLIVADGRYPPGMFSAPEQKHTDLPASEFDRTFLLCEPNRFIIEWP
jgi:hypothetical protein